MAKVFDGYADGVVVRETEISEIDVEVLGILSVLNWRPFVGDGASHQVL